MKSRWQSILLLSALVVGASDFARAAERGQIVGWGATKIPAFSLEERYRQISAGYFHNLALTLEGRVVAWGYNEGGVCEVPEGLRGVAAVSAGNGHNLGLLENGTVVGWGINSSGQASVPPGLANVSAIAAGGYHSLAISNKTVIAWGSNSHGQTSVPAGLTDVVQIAAGEFHSLARRADGTVVAWGGGPQHQPPLGLADVASIAAGLFHSVALLRNKSVVAWGDGSEQRTNVPTGLGGVTHIATGNAHNICVREDGSIIYFGGNNYYGERNTPWTVLGAEVLDLSAGYAHNLILRKDGTVYSWGARTYAQGFGPGDFRNIRGIGAGYNHAMSIKGDGTVMSWGLYEEAQTWVPPGLGNVVEVHGGKLHSTALLSDKSLVVWGSSVAIGNFQHQFANIAMAASGWSYNLAVQTDRTVLYWNALGPTLQSFAPMGVLDLATGDRHGLLLTPEGTVVGFGDIDGVPHQVPEGLTDVVAVAAGAWHSVALRANGTAVQWGKTNVQVPANATNLVAIAAGSADTLAIRADRTVMGWGPNEGRKLDVPAGLENVYAIATGWKQSLALIPEVPEVTAVRLAGGQLEFDFTTIPGAVYAIEFSTEIAPANWMVAEEGILGNGSAATTGTPLSGERTFFRLVLR